MHPVSRYLLIPAMCLFSLSSVALAQTSPFADPKNLQALSPSISARDLGQTMKAFTRALGVRCTHCHVGVEGEPLASYDFASDEKATKRTARNMLRMVEQLNQQLLPEALDGAMADVTIECMTCHRGHRQPMLLEDRLQRIADERGDAAAFAEYRALRARHYGEQGLDFGDQPLILLAESSFAAGNLGQSRGWLDLALEHNPACETCLFYRAKQLADAGDTAAAIADLEALLVVRPEAPPIRAMLESLRGSVEGR